ncbi:MAG: hypothetical protein OEY92_01755 [Elusimicrobiota bacterium]|nr:hypothetical protein [Elusimicrobiota bacterium]
MLIVGIDENGLGFRNQRMLGPLVVTASAFRISRSYDCKKDFFWHELKQVISRDKTEKKSLIVCDSKELYKSNDQKTYELAESTVLAFYSLLNRRLPRDFDKDFFPKIVLPGQCVLSECPVDWKSSLCGIGAPYSLPAWKAETQFVENVSEKLKKELRKKRIDFIFWKSRIFCPSTLNRAGGKNLDKYWLEVEAIADFISLFLENYGKEEISFFSGKIDGWGEKKILSCLARRFEIQPFPREAGMDIFAVSHKGKKFKLRFIKSGDKFIFPISLSSIFGKYIREIFIRRINEFFRKFDSSLDWCGGYRQGGKFDGFLKRAAEIATMEKIPQECLFR